MSIARAIILGVVQGITEFFPVSSSGHLVIFQALFGLKEPQLAFDIFLHLGTLLSILIFFRADIVDMIRRDRNLLYYIAVGSIPTFIVAFLFKDTVEKFFGMPKVTGLMLVLTGAWLIAATFYSKRAKGAADKRVGTLNSLAIGTAQAIAIIPGISRSGSTIATGMLCGLDKLTALRFSLFLAIPAVLGAALLKAHKIGASLIAGDAVFFLAGGLTAMITGLFAIKVLLALVRNNRLDIFGIYCIIAGIGVVMLV